MTFQRKTEKAQAELLAAQIWRSNALPPIYRLALAAGLEVRPPHYYSFLFNLLSSVIWFGLIWGGLMWMFTWGAGEYDMQHIMLQWTSSSLLFGLLLSLYYRSSAKKHKLSCWCDL